MSQSIYDPVVSEVDLAKRTQAQEDFGRHLVEQRNRMAELVRKWIETDTKFPIPIYDKLLDKVRAMDAPLRADVASIALLMADQVVGAVLGTFDGGDEMESNGKSVNYAIVGQLRDRQSEEVIDQVDINRGKPIIAVWKSYTRWLGKFAPSKLRPSSKREGGIG